MQYLPKNYLSWSQYFLFKKSPKEYKRLYVLGEEGFKNYAMFLGSKLAEELEKGKKSSQYDMVEHIKNFLPRYPHREHEMTATVKIDGDKVVLLGKMDGCDKRKNCIGDHKASLNWTQAKTDKSEQLTWYAYIYWLNLKKIPRLFIHWIETIKNKLGKTIFTGKVETFETKRTVQDFLSLQSDINVVYRGIKKMYHEEWSNVI